MSKYFVGLKKFHPISEETVFVGPYTKTEMEDEISYVAEHADYECVFDGDLPKSPERAIKIERLTKTIAMRLGLRLEDKIRKKKTLIGNKIPLQFEQIGFEKPEKSSKKSKVVEAELREIEIDSETEDKQVEYAEIANGRDDVLEDWEKSEAVIITKFPSNVEWLRQHGIYGEVQVRARPDLIENKSVIGIIPYRLGAKAKRVGVIDLPRITADMAGKQLTTDDLYEANAQLRWFRVIEERSDWAELFNLIDKKGVKQLLKILNK